MVCMHVQQQLRERRLLAFDELSPQRWADLLRSAKAKVEGGVLSVDVQWRNPDLSQNNEEFRVKEDAPA